MAIGRSGFEGDATRLFDVGGDVAVEELFVKIGADEAGGALAVLEEEFEGTEKRGLEVLEGIDILVAGCFVDEKEGVFDTTVGGAGTVANVDVPGVAVVFGGR